MSNLTFNDERLYIESHGTHISLLSKEYALFRFLYIHVNRVFSREQLLDRVWAGEYPVDRTVDDHVYRLRKKLKGLPGLKIETVRNVGYCLTQSISPDLSANESFKDPAVQEAMNGVFARYHRLGEGRAMLALANQKQMLGFELNVYYELYIHFVEGDLQWFLETSEPPMRERIYWLLLFYIFVNTSEHKSELCEQALDLRALPAYGHEEMEILNIANLYASEGKIEKAKHTLSRGREKAIANRLDGFLIPIEISELYIHLIDGQLQTAYRQSLYISELLEQAPYLRELADYQMLEGTRLWLSGEIAHGQQLLGQGLETFERSGFVPNRLLALHRVHHILQRQVRGSDMERLYFRKRAQEAERLGWSHSLQARLSVEIHRYLEAL
ncbi:helix-turn-helix domain-containing protein [Saccharibacillus sp. JS10]|uniref:winged helix-turn-helix domain-containing protein n=1 Tax=Saccharibacillus sp. JS10 TaxID=2950552 RepID=UPI00210D309F|nr:helix-turn-helix domain-containing protein [Saccharibacillus sp. JS10]MCQ4088030.1 winged helix-turn-helix domain-containing protein [Saccharibacillus sp. JS10]